MSYTNTDRDGLDWPEATQMVIDGNAAFNVMGDWAVAAFEEQGKTLGTDFTAFPVPGTDGVFDFLADSFTLPVGAPPRRRQGVARDRGLARGPGRVQQGQGIHPGSHRRRPGRVLGVPADGDRVVRQRHDRLLARARRRRPVATLNAISDATSKFTSGGSDLATYQSELAAATAQG